MPSNNAFEGVGTIIAGVLACCCETLLIGLLQTLTAPFLIGWIWSIWWGWDLLQVSRKVQIEEYETLV